MCVIVVVCVVGGCGERVSQLTVIGSSSAAFFFAYCALLLLNASLRYCLNALKAGDTSRSC